MLRDLQALAPGPGKVCLIAAPYETVLSIDCGFVSVLCKTVFFLSNYNYFYLLLFTHSLLVL